MPVRRRRQRGARRARPSAPRSTGTATCPASARASATATASTARTTRRAGHRFNPAKLLIDPYAKSIEGKVRWNARQRAPVRARRGDGDDADLEPDDEDDAVAIPQVRRDRPALRLGGRPPAATRRCDRDGDLRDARQGLHEARIRACARTCAGRTPAWPPRRRSRTSRRSASPRSSCCPSTTSPTRTSSHERGLTNYWGYSTIGFFAPHSSYAATGIRGQEVREFKGMVKALHRAGHRGDPRRGLQPHRRGQPPRARCSASRASTTSPTTGCRPTTRTSTWTSRARATRSTPSTRACCG